MSFLAGLQETSRRSRRSTLMAYRILYFRGGILEDTSELSTSDLVEVAKVASATHPHLTAEIWRGDRKVAICGPSWDQKHSHF